MKADLEASRTGALIAAATGGKRDGLEFRCLGKSQKIKYTVRGNKREFVILPVRKVRVKPENLQSLLDDREDFEEEYPCPILVANY